MWGLYEGPFSFVSFIALVTILVGRGVEHIHLCRGGGLSPLSGTPPLPPKAFDACSWKRLILLALETPPCPGGLNPWGKGAWRRFPPFWGSRTARDGLNQVNPLKCGITHNSVWVAAAHPLPFRSHSSKQPPNTIRKQTVIPTHFSDQTIKPTPRFKKRGFHGALVQERVPMMPKLPPNQAVWVPVGKR